MRKLTLELDYLNFEKLKKYYFEIKNIKKMKLKIRKKIDGPKYVGLGLIGLNLK